MSLSSLLVFYHDQMGHVAVWTWTEFVNTTDPAAAGINLQTMCSNLFGQENHYVCTSVVSDVLWKGLDDRKDWWL